MKHAIPLLLLLFVVAPALAEGDPEGWAYDLAAELMSPFCPGRTLADCPSQAARSLVMWMAVQEAAGRSRDDVEAELFERYGEVMLPAPRAEGIGLTAYGIPAAGFVGGGLLVGFFLRRQTRGARRSASPPTASDPDLERIVDEELARS